MDGSIFGPRLRGLIDKTPVYMFKTQRYDFTGVLMPDTVSFFLIISEKLRT